LGHPGLGLTDSCHLIFDVTYKGETSSIDFTSRSYRDVIRYNWRGDGTSYCWINLDSGLFDFSVEGLGNLDSFHIMFPAPLSVGTFEAEIGADFSIEGQFSARINLDIEP